MANSPYCVVMTTVASGSDADALARMLLEKKLAACIQVLDINSWYTWQGQAAHEPEKLLLVKTRQELYAAVEAAMRAAHPYDTPEILAVPVTAGSAGYLRWISEVTG